MVRNVERKRNMEATVHLLKGTNGMTPDDIAILKRMIDQEKLEGTNAPTHRIRIKHIHRRDVLRELHSLLYAAKVKRKERRDARNKRKQDTRKPNAKAIY